MTETLIDSIRKAQQVVFEATGRDNANWIRFAEDGPVHKAILAGELEGVTAEAIEQTETPGCLIVRVPARGGA